MSYQQYRPNSMKVLPLVVKNLLIINVLMYLATVILENQGINLTNKLALHYPISDKFQPYQLITYMFMHGSVEHIFFNMFALWMFGNVLENLWGPKRFLIFYMITGVGAALIFLAYQAFEYEQAHKAIQYLLNNPTPDNYLELMQGRFKSFYEVPEVQTQIQGFARDWSHQPDNGFFINRAIADANQLLSMQVDNPMVGASGAIFGILIAFGMLFPNTELFLMFIPIPIKAKYAVILYGAVELFLGVAQFSGDNVAHFAHLGGALFGFILVKYWQKKSNRFY